MTMLAETIKTLKDAAAHERTRRVALQSRECYCREPLGTCKKLIAWGRLQGRQGYSPSGYATGETATVGNAVPVHPELYNPHH